MTNNRISKFLDPEPIETRAMIEINLLFCLAPLADFGVRVATEAGINFKSFSSIGNRIVWTALVVFSEQQAKTQPTCRAEVLTRIITTQMAAEGCLDGPEVGDWTYEGRWTEAAIQQLATRICPASAEILLPRLITQLLAFTSEKGGVA